jgi:hypothetical protein
MVHAAAVNKNVSMLFKSLCHVVRDAVCLLGRETL